MLAIVLFILLLETENARQYERESYHDRLLRLEADEFCPRMALLYCRDDFKTIQDGDKENTLPEAYISLRWAKELLRQNELP